MSHPGLPTSFTLHLAGEAGDSIPFLAQQLAQLLARRLPSLFLHADPPAEIRAPPGARSAALSYQLRCGSQISSCPEPVNLLLALRPSALHTLAVELAPEALVLIHAERFALPLPCLTAQGRLYPVPLTSWNRTALAPCKLSQPECDRCESFFLLGLLAWMLDLPLDPVQHWLRSTFAHKPEMARATELALKAGHTQAQSASLPRCELPPTSCATPGTYRLLSGNEALALGLLSAAQATSRCVLLAAAAAPVTAELLATCHELACDRLAALQCPDEAAAIAAALGAAYGGQLGVALSSGPGLSVQSELLGLAVLTQLPVVVIHVQHGGPALALPRQVEQADLAAALHGRTGVAPLVVLAQARPAEGVELVVQAARLAIEGRTPVIVLSDVHLLELSELVPIPDSPFSQCPALSGWGDSAPPEEAHPYAVPGTPGGEHCFGPLEYEPGTAKVSFDPGNHARQSAARVARVGRLQAAAATLPIEGDRSDDPSATLLLLGWGSSYGPLREACLLLRGRGHAVAHAHLRQLHPIPTEVLDGFQSYRAVLVVELNEGQLAAHLRSLRGWSVRSYTRPGGAPFRVAEILAAAEQVLFELQEQSA